MKILSIINLTKVKTLILATLILLVSQVIPNFKEFILNKRLSEEFLNTIITLPKKYKIIQEYKISPHSLKFYKQLETLRMNN